MKNTNNTYYQPSVAPLTPQLKPRNGTTDIASAVRSVNRDKNYTQTTKQFRKDISVGERQIINITRIELIEQYENDIIKMCNKRRIKISDSFKTMMTMLKTSNNPRLQTDDNLNLFLKKIKLFLEYMHLNPDYNHSTSIMTNMLIVNNRFISNIRILDIPSDDLKKIAQCKYIVELSRMYARISMITLEITENFEKLYNGLDNNQKNIFEKNFNHISYMCQSKELPNEYKLKNFLDNSKFKNKDGIINYELINDICKTQYYKGIPSDAELNNFLDNPRFKNEDNTINYSLINAICIMQYRKGILSNTELNNFFDNPRFKNEDNTINDILISYIYRMQYQKGLPSVTKLNNFLDNPRFKNEDNTINYKLISYICQIEYRRGIPPATELNNFLGNPRFKNKNNTINYSLINAICRMLHRKGIPSETKLNNFLDDPKFKNKDGTTNYDLISDICIIQCYKGIPNTKKINQFLKTVPYRSTKKAHLEQPLQDTPVKDLVDTGYWEISQQPYNHDADQTEELSSCKKQKIDKQTIFCEDVLSELCQLEKLSSNNADSTNIKLFIHQKINELLLLQNFTFDNSTAMKLLDKIEEYNYFISSIKINLLLARIPATNQETTKKWEKIFEEKQQYEEFYNSYSNFNNEYEDDLDPKPDDRIEGGSWRLSKPDTYFQPSVDPLTPQPKLGNSTTDITPSVQPVKRNKKVIQTTKQFSNDLSVGKIQLINITRIKLIEKYENDIINACNNRGIKISKSFKTMMTMIKTSNIPRLQTDDNLKLFLDKIKFFLKHMHLNPKYNNSTSILTGMLVVNNRFMNNVSILDIPSKYLKKIAQCKYIVELSRMYERRGIITLEIIKNFEKLYNNLDNNQKNILENNFSCISGMCTTKGLPYESKLKIFLDNPKFKNEDNTIKYDLINDICRIKYRRGIPSDTELNNFLGNPRFKNKYSTINYDLISDICKMQDRKGIPSDTELNNFLDNPKIKNKNGTINYKLISYISSKKSRKGLPNTKEVNQFLTTIHSKSTKEVLLEQHLQKIPV